jgi:hypothetical protein
MLSDGRSHRFPHQSGIRNCDHALFIASLVAGAAGYSVFHYDLYMFGRSMGQLPPERIARRTSPLRYELH